MFSLAVSVFSALLLVAQLQFSNAEEEKSLPVQIVPSYDPPCTFTLDPPYYRAASPLTLTCQVEGVDDYTGLYYEWSSTCSGNCFTRGGTTRTVSTPYLHSFDTGVHTCMVYDTLGCTGNANITVNVVGAGIFIPSDSRVLPNNSLILSTSQNVTPSFRCASGSSKSSVGKLIGLHGTDITFSTSDPFLTTRGGSYDPGSMYMRNVRQLDWNDTGIYTYRTPDENGHIVDVNVGIYLSDYADPPICLSLDYTITEDLHTLCCTCYGSPPTKVIWKKDGERIFQNETFNENYQFSQKLVERTTSTYKITLTINATIENVVGVYSCCINNTLGTSNELTQAVEALEVSGHESPVLVGLSRSIICSTHLEVTRMEWVLVGVDDPVEEREDGGQNLTLPIDPTNTGLDGAKFICKVTTVTGKIFQETITVEVKELTHVMDIDGPSNPLSAGEKYTFTCTVTSDLAPSVKWLDPDDNEVDSSDIAVIMDEMVNDGNTTTLRLHFDPVKTSHGGTYACVSSISEPSSLKRMTRHLKVKITSNSTTVKRFPSTGTVYTSDGLSLTCVTTVNQAVDVPVQVTHQWAGPGGVVSTSGEVSVSSVASSGQNYSSTVFFSSLRSSHSGTYTCSSTISAVVSSIFIASSAVQTASTSFTAAIRVTIDITYTSPGTYPVYSPPNYRTASGVSLRCVASGYSGSISYQWTSTCSSCFASGSSSQTISDSWLKSRDAGVHSCSVTDGLGNTGSNSTTMKIVGAGIYIESAHSSQTKSYSGVQGVQPSNTYATIYRRYETTRVDVYCCSNVSSAYYARFILPNGLEYSSNSGSYLRISRFSGSSTYAGCIQLSYYSSSYYFYLTSHNYDGIHTCKIPDSSGNYLYENFGLYNEGYSTSLSIYQLQYSTSSDNSIVFTCRTRYSPPSSIKWYKDNELLNIDGYTTNMSVSVTNRGSSYFEIRLTICDSPENVMGRYKCEAGNRLGTDIETYHSYIDALHIQCSRSKFVVGETVTCSCSSDIGTSGISWYNASSGSSSTGSLSISVTTDSHGEMYTCSRSGSCGVQQESLNVSVTVPDVWATVSISNSTGENALNNTNYTLTCTVTVIEGMTLPVTVEWVGPDGGVVTSEGNRMVGEVEVQGTVSTLSLSFSPVFSSDGGSYTCRATVSVSWMATQPPQLSATADMPVTTQALFQFKMYPLTHCSNWEVDKALDLEMNIKRDVEKAVRERCDCDFSSSAIYSGEFSCQFTSCDKSECDLATYVTYRAVLNGTSDLLPADQLMQHIQDWRELDGTLLYNVFRLRLASTSECSLEIDSFKDTEC